MRLHALILVTLLGAGATACKHEQSYREGLKLFCDAPDRMPDGRNKLTESILAVEKQVTNKAVREDMGQLANVEGGRSKLDLLRADMKKAGLDRCAVLEVWEDQIAHPKP